MATPEKIIYDVEVAPGLVIPIVGSENETDDDLIAKARTHPKFVALQNKNNAPQAEVAQTNKAVVADDSTNLEPGVLPELSSPAELAKTAKKGTDFTSQSVTQPPVNSQPDRSEETTFDLLSQGKFGEAFNTIPETVQKGILVGLPLTAATIAGGLGLKYARSKNEIDGIGPTRGQGINPAERIEPKGGLAETPSNNIKSRTFEAGNYGQQNIRTTPKGISAKETQIADDIKNRYGFDLNDLKNRFGLSDVPINDVTQAEMLANTVRNQEAAAAAAPAEAPKTPASQTPAERIVNGVKMTEAQYQYYINEAKPGLSPAQSIEEMNAKAATPAAPTQEIKPAPVAETPKAPAPPPEAAPKAAVPPKKAPKEKLAMPEGWGKGMSWLTTVHGAVGAQAFIDQYNNGKPFASHKEMEEVYKNVTMRPKYSDIPKSVRQERGITPRASLPNLPLTAVPPPSLRPAPQLGGGGGSMMRGIGDFLQLKQ